MGILFLFSFLKWRLDYGFWQDWPVLAWWLGCVFFILILAIYDFRHHILPDKISYLFAITAFLGNVVFLKPPLGDFFLSFLPAVFLYVLWLVSKGRWMGLGDAKFMIAAGLFLSWPGAMAAVIFAFWTGALGGLALLAAGRAPSLKSEIAFGPFLALGTMLSFFFPGALSSLLFLW